MSRLRWWLFVGVAHETPRMVYEPPLVRIARAMRAVQQAYIDFGRQLGELLTPVLRKLVDQLAPLARALAGEPPR